MKPIIEPINFYPMKDFQTVCREGDENKNDMQKLTELWAYIRNRRNCYSDSHFEFMREHLNKYAKIIKENQRREALKQRLNDYE